jgi:hypothetical protein
VGSVDFEPAEAPEPVSPIVDEDATPTEDDPQPEEVDLTVPKPVEDTPHPMPFTPLPPPEEYLPTLEPNTAYVRESEFNARNRINFETVYDVSVAVFFEGEGTHEARVRISDRYNDIYSKIQDVSEGGVQFDGINVASLQDGVVEVYVEVLGQVFRGSPAIKGQFGDEVNYTPTLPVDTMEDDFPTAEVILDFGSIYSDVY